MYLKPAIDYSYQFPVGAVAIAGAHTSVGRAILEYLFAHEPTVSSVLGLVSNAIEADELQKRFAGQKSALFLIADSDQSLLEAAALKLKIRILFICGTPLTELKTATPFDKIPLEDMLHAFKTNVLDPQQVMAAFRPKMGDVEDSVIACLTTSRAVTGRSGDAAISASRHALEGLVKCAAADYADTKTTFVRLKELGGSVASQMKRLCETSFWHASNGLKQTLCVEK